MAEEAVRPVLGFLEKNEEITDSGQFASERGIDHQEITNIIKSRYGFKLVDAQDIKREKWVLTDEGRTYAAARSPEVQLFSAIPPEGISLEELQVIDPKDIDALKRRKLISPRGDWKHLEFKEYNFSAKGLVCDRGLTFGDLIGVFNDFFGCLGMSKLKFKPAYNPYTEPSMEIFGYYEGLKNSVEIGNSGMFRPEMLLPMGLPEDVRVIAWGLSLERPTMILYGIDNIRDLFGHKVDISLIKRNPLCRIGIE
ncbi:phenylalanine--tRNA ligase alpha subunit, cytoplasmic-like [Actinidia eriantha]|uniref:phenylalanine--tRNA ligase alpha subunit, cytoplasmic-like n=1 Tax=Actinidia eriantha TaxID=165200 RepID=UPI00258F0886|nr:phenylalanine--tRNA ligase alpha subunit, cytoplasmic-like [Actinidia eriantha]